MYPYHHPGAQRILELPVYRCAEEQHRREQEEKCEAAAQSIKKTLQTVPHIDPDRMAQEIERVRSDWLRWYGHLWDFNEVVAWVRLYARAGSIGASLFVTNKRVSKRMVHKRFVWDSWNFLDISVSDNQSSAEIFDDLKNAILAESRRRFKGQRYIDIGVLDVLGPHLDWVALTRRAAPRTELVP